MVHRGTRSKAVQARRAERGILHCKEESCQVSSVKLLERLEINALSHGYSGADCRGDERNAETDRGAGKPIGRHNSQLQGWWTHGEFGRPSNFGSGEEKSLEKSFPVWQRKMQNYIISVFPDLREPLDWAAMTAVPITPQLAEQ